MSAASHSIAQTILSPTGANSTFWVLQRANIDVLNLQIIITIGGYLTSTTQSNGNISLDRREYVISGSDVLTIANAGVGNFNTAILNWVIANQSEFSGGVVS